MARRAMDVEIEVQYMGCPSEHAIAWRASFEAIIRMLLEIHRGEVIPESVSECEVGAQPDGVAIQ